MSPAQCPLHLLLLDESSADHLESGRFSGVKPLSWLALEGGSPDNCKVDPCQHSEKKPLLEGCLNSPDSRQIV